MGEWAQGTGRYGSGGMYVVKHGDTPIATFLYRQQVGGRRVGRRSDNVLVIPANGTWPELVLTQGMSGYWEVGDEPGEIFAPELPEDAVLYNPSAPPKVEIDARPTEKVVDEAFRALAESYGLVKGSKRAVWYIARIAGVNYVLAYNPSARKGTEGSLVKVLRCLDEKATKALVTRLRNQTSIEATQLSYLDGLLRERVRLNATADMWVWDDGEEEPICPYGQAATVDLRALIDSGKAVQMGLNRCEGSPLRVVGFLARSHVAYTGVDGDQLTLLVPCPANEQRTIFVAAQHDTGYGVWGFTVSRRFDELGGRVVNFAGSPKRVYFINPGTEDSFVIPGIG